jgi:carboxylesterase type B
MPAMAPAREPELVRRDESQDDYDLLTYQEVAARLSEEIVAESERITDLEASGGDMKALEESKQRLALLRASKQRYEQHAKTADVFMQRFGLRPRISGPRGQ